MSQTVAEVIVETLQAAGVKHCWGVPGDTLNYVTDAIRCSGIRWVHVRHEEAGGFAAGAEALLTGDLTACAGSYGPGSPEAGGPDDHDAPLEWRTPSATSTTARTAACPCWA